MVIVAFIAVLLLAAEIAVLLRESRNAAASVTVPRQPRSFMKKFISWEGLFVFLSGVGLTMIGLQQYDKARYFFVAAAIVFVVAFASSVNQLYPKTVTAILGSLAAGIVVNAVNNWVTGLEREQIIRNANTEQAVVRSRYRTPAIQHSKTRGQPHQVGNIGERSIDLATEIMNDPCENHFPSQECRFTQFSHDASNEPYSDYKHWRHYRSNIFRVRYLGQVNQMIAELATLHYGDRHLDELLSNINGSDRDWQRVNANPSHSVDDLRRFDIDMRQVEEISRRLRALGNEAQSGK